MQQEKVDAVKTLLILILMPVAVFLVKGLSRLFTAAADILASHRTVVKYGLADQPAPEPIDTREKALAFLTGPDALPALSYLHSLALYRFLIVIVPAAGILLLIFIALQIGQLAMVIVPMALFFTFLEYKISFSLWMPAKKLMNEAGLRDMEDDRLIEFADGLRSSLGDLEKSSAKWRFLVIPAFAAALILAGLQVNYCLIPHDAAPGIRELRGFQYRLLEDGSAELTGYTGIWKRIRVPDAFENAPVTAVGEKAFDRPYGDYLPFGRKDLEEIVLPDGLVRIGAKAFYGCLDLHSLRIPDSVECIGDEAFVLSGIRELELPRSLREIGMNPFDSQEISVAEDHPVFCLQDGAFWNRQDGTLISMTNLNDLTVYRVPDGIRIIGERVFSGASRLESIVLPEGLLSIGKSAFSSCRKLKTVDLPDSLVSVGDIAFYRCGSLEELTLPAGLETIGEYAFYECSDLGDVTLPDGLTEIGPYAFCGCAMERITVPSGVKEVAGSTFRRCGQLRGAVLAEGVESIGSHAFADCPALETIVIPSSVSKMERRAVTPKEGLPVCVVLPGSKAEEICRDRGLPYQYPETEDE